MLCEQQQKKKKKMIVSFRNRIFLGGFGLQCIPKSGLPKNVRQIRPDVLRYLA